MEPQQQKPTSEIRLDQKTLGIAALVIGALAVIFLFFPDLKVLTILFAIIGLGLGIFTYLQKRSPFPLLGIIFSAYPLFFFIQMHIIQIYIKEAVGDRLGELFSFHHFLSIL